MASAKKYWKGFGDLTSDPDSEAIETREFPTAIPIDPFLNGDGKAYDAQASRRDFLKWAGFSTAAATLAACEGPVVNAIPYVVKPDELNPGVADYYASTVYDGHDFSSVLVKTREGRPIKLQPNTSSGHYAYPNTRVQASLLSLYDIDCLKEPLIAGRAATWAQVDKRVRRDLDAATAAGQKIVLLTAPVISPTFSLLWKQFKQKYPSAEWVAYNPISNSGAVAAYQAVYGQTALPGYDFTKADVIVSVAADFLGDWFGGDHSRDYALRRNPNQAMSRHFQLESNLSLTGANADYRIPIKPSEQAQAVAQMYRAIAWGQQTRDPRIRAAIEALKKAGPAGLLVSGTNDGDVQLLVDAVNRKLRSRAYRPEAPVYLKAVTDAPVKGLISDMKDGRVGVLLSHRVNPVYDAPDSSAFVAALKNVKTFVSFDRRRDETASLAHVNAISHHAMERWGDAKPKIGIYTLQQPTIRPLFQSRQMEDSLIAWMGGVLEGVDAALANDSTATYIPPVTECKLTFHDLLKKNWTENILKGDSTWFSALRAGYYERRDELHPVSPADIDLSPALTRAENRYAKTGKIELQLYSEIGMGAGAQADNPWLQEFPDPLTRATWDNYLTISKVQADELGLKNWRDSKGALNGDRVNLSVKGRTVKNVPVLITAGQTYGSVGLAFGYGREKAGKTALINGNPIGVNAFQLYVDRDAIQTEVQIEKADGAHGFALTQLYDTMMGRGESIVKETTAQIYNRGKSDKSRYNPSEKLLTIDGKQPVSKVDMWAARDRSLGPWFNLSIDLNACTGCGACVVACHAENNVPVVGKDEVRRFRDMHWLRIDRYYASDMSYEKAEAEGRSEGRAFFRALEQPEENPEVVFQPVMCQHCNHAPCETVCPVAATSHGVQGQNQMIYNRCVGTRYCANNCPYKVRRFNWFRYAENDAFDFHMNNDLGRMVLNPDVVVRSRGVMEKCSMCIQMTQASILKAKREKRPLRDADLSTACATACATGALVFGDIDDENSEVHQLHDAEKNKRKYYLLEAVGTQPNVFYNLKVRNKIE
ncbi:MAG: TAT-variant-translocated molybdopterin oxidoreductase [Flavobacteriales bacterium]